MKKIFYILAAILFFATSANAQCGIQAGNAAVYNGSNYHFASGAKLSFSGDRTVEAWIKPTSLSNAAIVANGGCNSGYYYYLGLNGNGQLIFKTTRTTPFSTLTYTSDVSVLLNEWTHVAATYIGNSSVATLYINGTAVNSSVSSALAVILQSTYNLNIGYGGATCSDNFIGEIDEVRVWGMFRSASQIKDWHKNSVSSIYSSVYYSSYLFGLVASYSFNPPNQLADAAGTPAPLGFQGSPQYVASGASVDVASNVCQGYGFSVTNGGDAFSDGSQYNGAGAITFQAWIYPTAYPATVGKRSFIIAKADYANSNNSSFALYLQRVSASSVRIAGEVFTSTGSAMGERSFDPNSATPTIPLNQWSHVKIRWSSGQPVNILVTQSSGTTFSNLSAALGGTIYSSATNYLFIGRSTTSDADERFNGYIDEVAIYDADIASGNPRNIISSHANLKNYWRFSEADRNVVTDEGCSKHHLIVQSPAVLSSSFMPCSDEPTSIGPVKNLTATTNDQEKITVTWNHPESFVGGLIPQLNGRVAYDVFRDGSYLTTQSSAAGMGINTYIDNNPTCEHTYTVRAFWRQNSTNAILFYSPDTSTTGRIPVFPNLNFQVTKGTHLNKTVLTWGNISSTATDGFEVKRNGQQIAVLSSPNATQHTDFDGIPGVRYTYQIKPLAAGHDYKVCPDTGWIKENGRLSGYVRSPLNAPVPGVTVTATANVLGQNYTYTDTTDASGFYEIRNVYYDLEATYTLTPSKGTHGFSPASLNRTLDIQAFNAPQANFTDTSVFTVSGRVYYPDENNGVGCGTREVKILVNGQDIGIVTSDTGSRGHFTYTAQQEGNYTFTPVYKNHTFDPPSQTLFIEDNTSGVNFLNNTVDSFYLDLKGYCNQQISDSSKITLRGVGTAACYEKTFTIDGSSVDAFGVVVPAQEYNVELTQVNNLQGQSSPVIYAFGNLGTLTRYVDLRDRDSVEIAGVSGSEEFVNVDSLFLPDTTIVLYDTVVEYYYDTFVDARAKAVKYIYGGALSIEIDGQDTACNGKYIFSQGNYYPVRIRLWRNYDQVFAGAQPCPVDTADLVIFDDISDSSLLYYTLDTSLLWYRIDPGLPNIIAPHTKFFFVSGEVWDAGTATNSFLAIVEGNQLASPTFVTKTPELPFFVLHDPPGDGSSATLTQGTKLSYSYANEMEIGVETNSYVKVKLGTEVPVPFTGIVFSAGGSLNLSLGASLAGTSNEKVNTTFTVQNSYSTSGDESFIGEDGDIVVGASFNMIYGIANVVAFNDTTCQTDVRQELIWGASDFATTYAYTIGHIKNTLIPQLEFLRDYYYNLYPIGSIERDSGMIYQTYINVWQQVVDSNRFNIDNAEQVENRSFSSGVSYTSTTSYENTSSQSIVYQISIDAGIAADLNIGTEQNNVEVGREVKFKWRTSLTSEEEVSHTKEVAYTLTDDDPGDFFSVDIKRDKIYGTPAFVVAAGTSSCPHEEGTQQRDNPRITVQNPYQQNVPINSQATFTVEMSNLSESLETRTYNVKVDPNSNLDGAIIRLGGQLISQSPATFTIPSNASIYATMSVEPGPLAVNYTNLRLIIYSPCDEDVQDDATFRVDFQNTCSGITLFSPSNNWLVNDNSPTLTITYGGYNATNPLLTNVGLEYRRKGIGTWQNIPTATVSSATLAAYTIAPFYNVTIDFSSFPDGEYELRAYAQCSAGVRSYSSVLEGIVDKTSATLLGTPSPSDGVLNVGEEVSVTFTENLDCQHYYNLVNNTFYNVSLVRADNGNPVPFTYTCANAKIIFNIAQSVLDSLQNVLLSASVGGYYDLNGNVLQQPVVWSFVVNTSKVYWQPSGISASVLSGGTSQFTGILHNASTSSEPFTLTNLPNWLIPVGVPSSITQGASLSINFNINGILNPGVYKDTVFAHFTSLNTSQPLYIELTVYANSPNWTVVTYPTQMNIIANFSLTQANAPLSNDVNDRIAVFVGAECRGVANIQYAPAGNSYAAYITAYGNTGETFEFRIWDASAGREYQAVETQAFVENAQIGLPLAPKILHPAGVVQRIPLQTGWNWVSTYVQPNNPNVSDVLKYTAAASGNIIKTNDTYAQYSNTNGTWSGTLGQIGWQKSYQILVSQPTELQVIGQLLSDTVQLPVIAGWNWIGYPQSVIDSAAKFLKNYSATNGDVLQSDNAFSTYQSSAWNGTLQNLQPGRGYKLKSNSGGAVMVEPRSAPDWNPDIYGNEFNMNVTAVVVANGIESIGNFIVGAFINGTCVAVSSPQLAGTSPRVFLTLHGGTANNGQNLEFFIYDYATDSVYTPTYSQIAFSVDGQQGTIETAFVLSLESPLSVANISKDNFVLYQNVPNPFNGNTMIAFDMPRAEKVTLEVYDYTGKLIRQLVNEEMSAGKHIVQFNQDGLSSGIYFYRMRAGEYVQTKKMVVSGL